MTQVNETIIFSEDQSGANEEFFWEVARLYCSSNCIESVEECFGISFCYGTLDDGTLIFQESLETYPEFDGMVDFGSPVRDLDGKLHKKGRFKITETKKERRFYFNGKLTLAMELW